MEVDYQPPGVLKKPILIREKILVGPGPSNVAPRVMQALGQPLMGHFHQETFKIMDDIKAGVQYAFQTENALTLVISAAAHGGMEAALCNLVERGDTVLIGMQGYWGDRAVNMADRLGAKIYLCEPTAEMVFDPDHIEACLKKYRPVLFFVTHGDSSTGVCQPIDYMGALCHKYNTLLVVDAVASLAAAPVFTDRWGIDVVYTATQKAIGASPGMAPISFSPRAVEKILSRTTPVQVFYFDMNILGDYWYCFGRPRVYHHTVPVTLLYGLREALAMLVEETLEKCWERHRAMNELFHEGLGKIGLELFVTDPSIRLPTVTTIVAPKDLDVKKLQQFAMDKYRLEIAHGLGITSGKAIRMGIMGFNANPETVKITLKVLAEGFRHARAINTKL